MMNANVRRLVLDPSPRRLGWLAPFWWLFTGWVAAAWAMGDMLPNVLVGLMGGVWGLNCIAKIPVWQTLPLTQVELRQAQFWQFVGIPCFMIGLSNLMGFGLAVGLGPLRVSPREILAFVSAEIFMAFTMGISPFIQNLTGKLIGSAGAGFASVIPLFCSAALGWALMFGKSDTTGLLNLLIWCGSISFTLCLAGLVWNQRLPLLLPLPMGQSEQTRSSSSSVNTVSGDSRKTVRLSGFWTLFTASFGRVMPLAGIGFGVLAIVVLALGQRPFAALDGQMLVLRFAPLLCPILASSLMFTGFQRVGAGLPVSALGRALASQAIAPALLLPTWVFMIALGTLLHPEAMTPQWWVGCGLTSLIAISFGAVSASVALRFGPKGLALVSSFLGASLTFMFAYKDGRPFEGYPSHWGPIVIGLLIIIILTGWIWTYVELAYGRKAYQNRFPASARWRGTPT